MVVLVTLGLSAIGFYASLALGIHPERNDPYQIVARDPYKDAFSPIALAERGLPPNSSTTDVLPSDPEIRAISIYGDHVELRAAGILLKTMASTQVADLLQLDQLVNDPAWIEKTSTGHYVLKAALIVHLGAELTIGAPHVSQLNMLDEPSVFIGVTGGTLHFDSVTVKAIDPPTPSGAAYYQPSVLASDDAVMNATNSRFTNLGWDWNASYGVSWVVGATGDVVNSHFERNFIGAYTSASERMLFKDSSFNDNALYGLDPHTYSKNLVIQNVTAERNRAHGIIFSDHVTNSVISGAVSRFNGENGIMMDESSTDNRIENNVVTQNSGDGLVTTNSPRNTFVGNHVEDNRVGVRVSPDDASTVLFHENQIINNDRISENTTLDHTNTVLDNGGQVNWPVIRTIWLSVAAGIVLFMLSFALLRKEKEPYTRPLLSAVH